MKPLTIAMITPWKVRCGIASYSYQLTRALAETAVTTYIVRLPRFGIKTKELLDQVIDEIPWDDIDLVHVQEEYGLYQNLEGGFFGTLKALADLHQKPVITTMHAVGNWDADNVVHDASARVIVHNAFCARLFQHPAVIIPHGLDPQPTMDPKTAKAFYGIPDVPVVGYLGFLSNHKGVDTLIQAMESVKDAALVIAGGWHIGNETDYIIDMKDRSLALLQGRCQWLGWIPDEQLSSAYGAMDVVVYPSRFATESGALLNAISHGKAVVASNVGPFKEKKEQGILLTFQSETDLVHKINRLLCHQNQRRALEANATKYAEQYAWPKVAKLHHSFYLDTITRFQEGLEEKQKKN